MSWKRNRSGVLLILVAALLTDCRNRDAGKVEPAYEPGTVFVCPMHPEVRSDKPATCPICKMYLEPLPPDSLLQAYSPASLVLSRQATVKLQPAGSSHPAKLQGFVTPDLNRNRMVAARFGGRIEKLYVRFSAQYVKQGQRIMDLYSPELRTFQEEHLFLIRSAADTSLIRRSREKLSLLGLSKSQLEQLEEKDEVSQVLGVFSPYEGYVFFDDLPADPAASAPAPAGMSGMGAASPGAKPAGTVSSSRIREGEYVREGQALFSVNDLKQVWGLVSLPPEFSGSFTEGQPVELRDENGRQLRASVILTEQIYEESRQRFARLRLALSNPDNTLKLNSIFTAELSPSIGNSLHLPASAVYRTGRNSYVWVKTGSTEGGSGIFELRAVTAGPEEGGLVSVAGGLTPLEEVAREAGLMTDSETYLQVK